MKDWNRMQNAADGGGGGGGGRVFYQCENKQERYIYIEFEFVRIFHKV